jgi:hypothetical protein
MTNSWSRRRCLFGLAAAGAVLPASAAVAAPRSFVCRFCRRAEWSILPPNTFGVVRVAGPNDPSGVPQIVQHLRQVFSFGPDFRIEITQGQDNVATWIENGERVIAADVDFLLNVNRWAATRWGAIQVLGHEVGHHIGHSDDPHQNELEADYWSGWALRRLGAARHAASAAILAIGTETDTASHPNRHRRAVAILDGWDSGTE